MCAFRRAAAKRWLPSIVHFTILGLPSLFLVNNSFFSVNLNRWRWQNKKVDMQDWEFLLQQEGDESWLPITDRNLELIEGTYRVVGFCKRSDLDVEIRITFQSEEEGKFLRRSQRSRRIDSQGLVVIMPFTEVKAGRWEFYCSQDCQSDPSLSLVPQKLVIQVSRALESIEEKEITPSYFTSDLTEDLWATPTTEPVTTTASASDRSTSISELEDIASITDEISPEIGDVENTSIDIGDNKNYTETSLSGQKNTEKLYAVDLFNPRKVGIETKQITPLAGQIMPPKIPGAVYNNPDRLPQLPKFFIPQVEDYISSEAADLEALNFIDLDLDDLEDSELEDNIDRELLETEEDSSWIDEQFESLNLKEKFWSKINETH